MRVYLQGQGTLADKVVDAQVVRAREYKDGWNETGLRRVSLKEEVAALAAAAKATKAAAAEA
jgi:hypothetical protein